MRSKQNEMADPAVEDRVVADRVVADRVVADRVVAVTSKWMIALWSRHLRIPG
jgi:hypothetical protein